MKKLICRPKFDYVQVQRRIHHLMEGVKNRLYYTKRSKTEKRHRRKELGKLMLKRMNNNYIQGTEDQGKIYWDSSVPSQVWEMFFFYLNFDLYRK